jgi:hypothetical protein
MKSIMGGLLWVLAAGCAHAPSSASRTEDHRGLARVEPRAHILVVGPAASVHTSAEGSVPIALFVVDRVHGDDRDCARVAAPHREAPMSKLSTVERHLHIAAGQELCVASPTGPTEIAWHAHLQESAGLLALQ